MPGFLPSLLVSGELNCAHASANSCSRHVTNDTIVDNCSSQSWLESQIQRIRKLRIVFGRGSRDFSWGVADGFKPCESPTFCFVFIDRKTLETAPTRMRNMIGAAAERPSLRRVNNIEHQRRVNRHSRMQAGGLRPGFEAHACHERVLHAGWRQRNYPAIAGYNMAVRD